MSAGKSSRGTGSVWLLIAALLREIEALRSDPAALERAIREELNFVRPGEVIVQVE